MNRLSKYGLFINSGHPLPSKNGPEERGNLRRDNWAAIDMSAIERLSLTKNFLFISALDKDSRIFCNSRLDFGF